MKGERLKEILSQSGMPLAEIAKRLGMSPQHLNQVLSVADVKTGFIEKLSNELDLPIGYFFEVGEITGGNNTIGNGNNVVNSANEIVDKLVNEMAAQREAHERETSQLLEIIKNLTNK